MPVSCVPSRLANILKMHKGFLIAGSLFAFLSVALGAFAAHALKKILPADSLATFETGVRYQFYHTLALLLTGILYKEFRAAEVKWAGRMFITGIFLFSFSLYILALVQPAIRGIGIITPFGGVAFLTGWAFLFYSIIRSQKTL